MKSVTWAPYQDHREVPSLGGWWFRQGPADDVSRVVIERAHPDGSGEDPLNPASQLSLVTVVVELERKAFVRVIAPDHQAVVGAVRVPLEAGGDVLRDSPGDLSHLGPVVYGVHSHLEDLAVGISLSHERDRHASGEGLCLERYL